MSETLCVGLRGGGPELRFRALGGWLGRLRGLLGTDARASPVALVGCSSVHTFGMRYPLDVALVAADGRVLGAWRGLSPCRVASARGAWLALERPSRTGPWPRAGDEVGLAWAGGEPAGEALSPPPRQGQCTRGWRGRKGGKR